jgi:hypothetical protein
MDVQDAIHIIEESRRYEEFAKLKKVFKDRLKELHESDFTERGICYYYLLRIVLRSHLMYETEECREYLDQMNAEFEKQRQKYHRDASHFNRNELADFFRLMERSYGSLQMIFRKKDFLEESSIAYQTKMDYRRHGFWFNRKYWNWFEYLFLEKTSAYGNSFARWGVTAFSFAMIMATLYAGFDRFLAAQVTERIVSLGGHWYDYIYFSISTITSFGIGDIFPHTFLAKFLVSVEVFFGFIMLGIFISLIQKKM